MVPTQEGVSFPLECGLFYCLLLLPGIMSDQNTKMLAQPPHLSDIVRSLINSYDFCSQKTHIHHKIHRRYMDPKTCASFNFC